MNVAHYLELESLLVFSHAPESQLAFTRDQAFGVAEPALWNSPPLEIWQESFLPSFSQAVFIIIVFYFSLQTLHICVTFCPVFDISLPSKCIEIDYAFNCAVNCVCFGHSRQQDDGCRF